MNDELARLLGQHPDLTGDEMFDLMISHQKDRAAFLVPTEDTEDGEPVLLVMLFGVGLQTLHEPLRSIMLETGVKQTGMRLEMKGTDSVMHVARWMKEGDLPWSYSEWMRRGIRGCLWVFRGRKWVRRVIPLCNRNECPCQYK